MHRDCLKLGLSVGLLWSLGCSSEPPKGPAPAAKVTGTIKMDGKPLPTGELHFEVTGAPPRILVVQDGAFAGEAPIGKNKVELYIYTESPASPKYPKLMAKTNVAPEKFWGPNSALSATVEDGATNELKFDVSSK